MGLKVDTIQNPTSATVNLTLDTSGNTTVGANLALSGTAARITGDFGNATNANRVIIQNSTVNGGTRVSAIPNGTASSAGFEAYSGPSTDPNNASIAVMAAQGTTDVRFSSTISGTGTYLPMTFYTNGSEQMRISTAGIVTGTAGNLMLVQGTSQASTSGTAINFTGIPSWVKRITVTFAGVANANTPLVQLGTGATPTYTTSGYVGGADNRAATTITTTGFAATYSAGYTISGQMILCLNSANTWTQSVITFQTGFVTTWGAGYVALGAVLTAIRVTTISGTDAFSAGTINIQYE
jgi:hypothetical protein